MSGKDRFRRLRSFAGIALSVLVLWKPLAPIIGDIANVITVWPSLKMVVDYIWKLLQLPTTGNVSIIVGLVGLLILLFWPESNRSKQIRAFLKTKQDEIAHRVLPAVNDFMYPVRIAAIKPIEIEATTSTQGGRKFPPGHEGVVFSVLADLEVDEQTKSYSAIRIGDQVVLQPSAPPKVLRRHVVIEGTVHRQDQQYVELHPNRVNDIKP